MSQHIVFNLVFNEGSKMGSAIFCTFCIIKVIVKNRIVQIVRFSDYYLSIPLWDRSFEISLH
jgi:hypothetical protein